LVKWLEFSDWRKIWIAHLLIQITHLSRPIFVSHIRHGKFGMKPKRSLSGKRIQVDPNEKPGAVRVATFEGNTANAQLAITDVTVITSSKIALFPRSPLTLLVQQFSSAWQTLLPCLSSSASSFDRSLDSVTTKERHSLRMHAINDQTNTPAASRVTTNCFIADVVGVCDLRVISDVQCDGDGWKGAVMYVPTGVHGKVSLIRWWDDEMKRCRRQNKTVKAVLLLAYSGNVIAMMSDEWKMNDRK